MCGIVYQVPSNNYFLIPSNEIICGIYLANIIEIYIAICRLSALDRCSPYRFSPSDFQLLMQLIGSPCMCNTRFKSAFTQHFKFHSFTFFNWLANLDNQRCTRKKETNRMTKCLRSLISELQCNFKPTTIQLMQCDNVRFLFFPLGSFYFFLKKSFI